MGANKRRLMPAAPMRVVKRAFQPNFCTIMAKGAPAPAAPAQNMPAPQQNSHHLMQSVIPFATHHRLWSSSSSFHSDQHTICAGLMVTAQPRAGPISGQLDEIHMACRLGRAGVKMRVSMTSMNQEPSSSAPMSMVHLAPRHPHLLASCNLQTGETHDAGRPGNVSWVGFLLALLSAAILAGLPSTLMTIIVSYCNSPQRFESFHQPRHAKVSGSIVRGGRGRLRF